MPSNLLPFIVLAVLALSQLLEANITRAHFTEAAEEISNYVVTGFSHGSAGPPSPGTVALHPAFHRLDRDYVHLMPNPDGIPLYKYFAREPLLQKVAGDQSVLLTTHRNSPISLDNWKPWLEQNDSYTSLSKKQKKAIRNWIKQYFVDGVEDQALRENGARFLWSLQQSARPKTIWWTKSLVDKNLSENEFMELVALGDLLQFSETAALQMTDAEVRMLAPKLLRLLSLDQNKNLRTRPLNISQLMGYVENENGSRYKVRMLPILSYLLDDFLLLSPTDKQFIFHQVFVLFGFPPSEIGLHSIQLLRNDHPGLLRNLLPNPLISPRTKDYDRIKNHLDQLWKDTSGSRIWFRSQSDDDVPL
ncbi:hypothetical protein PGT21_019718 [Puccinia graminis f. sp. tritici]|uniref:Uncharacterized protein n=1 Tax=Puccinia graminis f. sp. tritici TaxID=56615 RepID=A0A5B0LL41_PUCGR|nr:hypothetical protein PGT21_019718 [Puccinia graminis f. sp. tritici]